MPRAAPIRRAPPIRRGPPAADAREPAGEITPRPAPPLARVLRRRSRGPLLLAGLGAPGGGGPAGLAARGGPAVGPGRRAAGRAGGGQHALRTQRLAAALGEPLV